MIEELKTVVDQLRALAQSTLRLAKEVYENRADLERLIPEVLANRKAHNDLVLSMEEWTAEVDARLKALDGKDTAFPDQSGRHDAD